MSVTLAATRKQLLELTEKFSRSPNYDWDAISLYYVCWNDPSSLAETIDFALLPIQDAWTDTRVYTHRHLLASVETVVAGGVSHKTLDRIVVELHLQRENNTEVIPEFDIVDFLFFAFLVQLKSGFYINQVQNLQASYGLYNLADLQDKAILQLVSNSIPAIENLISRGFALRVFGQAPSSVPIYWNEHFMLYCPIYTNSIPDGDSHETTEAAALFTFSRAYNDYLLKFTRSAESTRTGAQLALFMNAIAVRTSRAPHHQFMFADRLKDGVEPLEDTAPMPIEEITRQLRNAAGVMVVEPIQLFKTIISYQQVRCYKAFLTQTRIGYFSPVVNGIYPNMWRLMKVARQDGDYSSEPLTKTRAQVLAWSLGDSSDEAIAKYSRYVLLVFNPTQKFFSVFNYGAYLQNPGKLKSAVVLSNQRNSTDVMVAVPDMFVTAQSISATHHWMITQAGLLLIWNRRHLETENMVIETMFVFNTATKSALRNYFNVLIMNDLFQNLNLPALKASFVYGQSSQIGCRLLTFSGFTTLKYPETVKSGSATFLEKARGSELDDTYFEMRGNQILLSESIPILYRGTIQIARLSMYDPKSIPLLTKDGSKLRIIKQVRDVPESSRMQVLETVIDYCELKIGDDVFYFAQYKTPVHDVEELSVFDFGPISGKYILTRNGRFYQELNRNNLKIPLFLVYYIIESTGLKVFDKNLLNIRQISEYYRISVSFSGGRKVVFAEKTEEQLINVLNQMIRTDNRTNFQETLPAALEATISVSNAIIKEKLLPHNGTFLSFLIACGQLMTRHEYYFKFAVDIDHIPKSKMLENAVYDRFQFLDIRGNPEQTRQFFHVLNIWLYWHFQFWVMLLPIYQDPTETETMFKIDYAEYERRLNKQAQNSLGGLPAELTRYYLVFMPHDATDVKEGKFLYPISFGKSKSIYAPGSTYIGSLRDYLACSDSVRHEEFYITIGSRAGASKYLNGGLTQVYFSETRRAYGEFSLAMKTSASMPQGYRIENVYELPKLLSGDQMTFSRILHDVEFGFAKLTLAGVTTKTLADYASGVLQGTRQGAYQFVLWQWQKSGIVSLTSKLDSLTEKYYLARLEKPHQSLTDLLTRLQPLFKKLDAQLDKQFQETTAEIQRSISFLKTLDTLPVVWERAGQRTLPSNKSYRTRLFNLVNSLANNPDAVVKYRVQRFFYKLNSELFSVRVGAFQPYTVKFRLLMSLDTGYAPRSVPHPELFTLDAAMNMLKQTKRGMDVTMADQVKAFDQIKRIAREVEQMGGVSQGRAVKLHSADLLPCLQFLSLFQLISPNTTLQRLRKRCILYREHLIWLTVNAPLCLHFIENQTGFVFSLILTCIKCTQVLKNFHNALVAMEVQGRTRQRIVAVVLFLKSIFARSSGDETVAGPSRNNFMYEKFLDRYYNYIMTVHLGINTGSPSTLLDKEIEKYFAANHLEGIASYNSKFIPYTTGPVSSVELQSNELETFVDICQLLKLLIAGPAAKSSEDIEEKQKSLRAKIQALLSGSNKGESYLRYEGKEYDLQYIFTQSSVWKMFYLSRMRALASPKLSVSVQALVRFTQNDISLVPDIVKEFVESEYTDTEQPRYRDARGKYVDDSKTDNPLAELAEKVRDSIPKAAEEVIDHQWFGMEKVDSSKRKSRYHYVREVLALSRTLSES